MIRRELECRCFVRDTSLRHCEWLDLSFVDARGAQGLARDAIDCVEGIALAGAAQSRRGFGRKRGQNLLLKLLKAGRFGVDAITQQDFGKVGELETLDCA